MAEDIGAVGRLATVRSNVLVAIVRCWIHHPIGDTAELHCDLRVVVVTNDDKAALVWLLVVCHVTRWRMCAVAESILAEENDPISGFDYGAREADHRHGAIHDYDAVGG